MPAQTMIREWGKSHSGNPDVASAPESISPIAEIDLPRYRLHTLNLDSKRLENTLQGLYEWAIGEAELMILWYKNRSKRMQRGAMLIRLAVIVLVAIGGMIPLLAQVLTNPTTQQPMIAPAWSSLFLAGAAALVGLDRFFGFSNSWMRFISTKLALENAIADFEATVATQRLALQGQTPTYDQANELLATCRKLVHVAHEMTTQETQTWIQEFSTNLKQQNLQVNGKPGVTEESTKPN